jgi:hypothetical protein
VITANHRCFEPLTFKRRIKMQTVLPSAETDALLFWALLASGQINMRKVDGWRTLSTKLIDLQPKTITSCYRRSRHTEFQPLSGRHGIVQLFNSSEERFPRALPSLSNFGEVADVRDAAG